MPAGFSAVESQSRRYPAPEVDVRASARTANPDRGLAVSEGWTLFPQLEIVTWWNLFAKQAAEVSNCAAEVISWEERLCMLQEGCSSPFLDGNLGHKSFLASEAMSSRWVYGHNLRQQVGIWGTVWGVG